MAQQQKSSRRFDTLTDLMRYLTGGTLLDRLRKQPLAIGEVEGFALVGG